MLDTARILRQRMEKVNTGQFVFFQTTQRVLPELEKAINELRSSVVVKDEALPQAEQTLQRLSDQIRAIKEATELDRLAVAKVAAGVGILLEENESQRDRMHETAALATLQQYYEIAARGSSAFWLDLLGLVDPPVFEEARAKFREAQPERAAALFGDGND